MWTNTILINGETRTGFEQFFECFKIDQLEMRNNIRASILCEQLTLKYFSSSNSEKTVPRTCKGFNEVQLRLGNLYLVSIFFFIFIEPGGGSSIPGGGGGIPNMGGGYGIKINKNAK